MNSLCSICSVLEPKSNIKVTNILCYLINTHIVMLDRKTQLLQPKYLSVKKTVYDVMKYLLGFWSKMELGLWILYVDIQTHTYYIKSILVLLLPRCFWVLVVNRHFVYSSFQSRFVLSECFVPLFITVKGRQFEVKQLFLEDILRLTGYNKDMMKHKEDTQRSI